MVEKVCKGEKSEHVYISIGSNMGDRLANLIVAIQHITEIVGSLISKSPIYETEPWGMESKSWFLNQIIVINTIISPQDLMSRLLKIEVEMGRQRGKDRVYEDRLIDIDILFYGSSIINHPGLQIPHPKISSRMFILKPLQDLSPGLIHPETSVSIETLLNVCQDQTIIRKWK